MLEELVGFDAREMWQAYADTWTAERRQMFLLRADLLKPLSTDSLVWDSLFNSMLAEDTLDVPFYTGPFGLWDDLERMRAYLASAWGTAWKPCWLIAITLVHEDGEPNEIQPDSRLTSGAWQCLGYDVSDQGLLSGLSNCGYGAEQPALATAWAHHLNRYHLFTEAAHARRFKAITDERVPEHAPFSVFGLYFVESRATPLTPESPPDPGDPAAST